MRIFLAVAVAALGLVIAPGYPPLLFTVSGCTITPAVSPDRFSFYLDTGDRRDIGDGVGCVDLGDGRHLTQLLRLRDEKGNPLLTVRHTEVNLDGATATFGRSDTITATSKEDPVYKTAATVTCGDLTLVNDGLAAHYGPF
jgi:hypothetical protein